MEAIAGTINVVLRQVVAKAERELRVAAGHGAGNRNQLALGTVADRSGGLSWYMSGMLQHDRYRSDQTGGDRLTAPDGGVVQWRERRSSDASGHTLAAVQPRLNWSLDDGGELNVIGVLQDERTGSNSDAATTNRVGVFPAPDYVRSLGRYDDHKRSYWGEVNWVAKLWGGKLDAKAGISGERADTARDDLSATIDDATRLRRLRGGASRETQWTSSGKFKRGMFDGHALAAGWEASREWTQAADRRVEGIEGAAPVTTDERFAPRVRRLAAFAQDEWNVTPQWSMYVGARWEGIRTESGGTNVIDSVSDNHVLSPVLQTLYKFPDKSGRQLRLALTRTYKAPGVGQLTARRLQADLNTRFTPDSSGNPALRPELANGIDATYERFTQAGAMFSLGASARHLHDVIRSTLHQDGNGLWLIQPVNDGNALVRSLELDAKFPLKVLVPDAPALDLRVNLNRNWSRVASVPGPDNRLEQQTPFNATFGVDFKRDTFGVGADFAFHGGGDVRVSREQWNRQFASRDLNAYVSYAPNKNVDVRLSLNNALGSNGRSDRRYQDAAGTSETGSHAWVGPHAGLSVHLKY
jgi:outer membrane receptor protein involved in Fe transport